MLTGRDSEIDLEIDLDVAALRGEGDIAEAL